MLKLIHRDPAYMDGYKAYCREFYDNNIIWFRPTNPDTIDSGWFERTADWYKRKENGLVPGLPKSIHYWAVDDDRFIGEFQLRPEFTEDVLNDFGTVGYSVRISEQGKGYGQEMLRQGLSIVKSCGLDKALLIINEKNKVSIHICEKLGGQHTDNIIINRKSLGSQTERRYWIYL